MAYHSIEAILDYCEKRGKKFYEAVLEDDMEERKVSREESIKEMYVMWDAMLLASTSYDGSARSASGLAGGQGAAMEEYRKAGDTLCGDYLNQVIIQALEMGESNACMRRIVAAPTAGACGFDPFVSQRPGRSSADREKPLRGRGHWPGDRLQGFYRRGGGGLSGGGRSRLLHGRRGSHSLKGRKQ